MPLDQKTSYIKSRIPQELWNEAKSVAALNGLTMTDWLIDIIRVAIVIGKKAYARKSSQDMAQE
jgi:antitoxin component of RelBE/YafQ-DinJ toxin-antitoxin module